MIDRFKTAIKKYGFKVRKIAFRPDILSVQFQNKHLMTIPSRMYGEKSFLHRDLQGNIHPDYFECEQLALAWNSRVKRTSFLDEDWEYEKDILLGK
jgi:hypothetical protein